MPLHCPSASGITGLDACVSHLLPKPNQQSNLCELAVPCPCLLSGLWLSPPPLTSLLLPWLNPQGFERRGPKMKLLWVSFPQVASFSSVDTACSIMLCLVSNKAGLSSGRFVGGGSAWYSYKQPCLWCAQISSCLTKATLVASVAFQELEVCRVKKEHPPWSSRPAVGNSRHGSWCSIMNKKKMSWDLKSHGS